MRMPVTAGSQGWLARRTNGGADLVVGAAIFALLYAVVRVGRDVTITFLPTDVTRVDTDPRLLPYYAARSYLRMFTALAFSFLFTLVVGYAAARSRRAERLIIPALDVLQSVPILGFLSVTVTAFIALFDGSSLGLEAAAVFAIFTSQAWNMTFAFYQSVKALPRDLDELSRQFRFTRWMRFWKVEVPSGGIGLVWNGMMSMGGAWFFLVAAEAISVLNRSYNLPGVGNYAGQAIDDGDIGRVLLAVATMAVMVISANVVFWRPLVAWAEKFKNEQTEASEIPRSVVLTLLRHSRWPRLVHRARLAIAERLGRVMRVLGVDDRPPVPTRDRRRVVGEIIYRILVVALVGFGLWRLVDYVTAEQGWSVFAEPLTKGLVTLGRVVVLVAVSSAVWVPIGLRIGLSPPLSRIAQPIVQVLASFPANFLFPLAVVVFIRAGITLDLGGILLMSLGAQWYILFNVIAGAQAIPSDLREAMDDMDVRGWQRWKRLYLPAIFPFYVTGGIAASGGAWNASIVAEVVRYGGTTLVATGLGAYIAETTAAGDFHKILAGVTVMSLYIVTINRFFWRRLYRVAASRYSL
jgi:NitT/TauT family transport system permease protein